MCSTAFANKFYDLEGNPLDLSEEELKTAISQWYEKDIHFEDIRPKLIDIYVKHFTEDEIKQLIAFYQSPIGRKMVREMPVVMKEGAEVGQEYTKSKIADLDAVLTPILMKYRDQMQGGAGGGAPGGPAPASGN
jgi:hypothetical protein